MHITCTQEDLSRSLQLLQAITATHNIIPVLANVRVIATEDRIEFQANNLELGMKTLIPGKVIEPGITTIPGKVFSRIAYSLPAEEIGIQVTPDHHIDIVYTDGAYKLLGLSDDEFPEIPIVSSKLLEVSGDTLCSMLNDTRWFTSKQNERPELSGVYFDLATTPQCFVGADSRRIALSYNQDLIEMAEKSVTDGTVASFIVSGQTCNQVVSAFNASQYVGIGINKNNIIFNDSETIVSGRLIASTFPDYKQLLPNDNNLFSVIFDTREFKSLLRRIEPLVDEQNYRIIVELVNNQATISCEGNTDGVASEYIECIRESGEEKFVIALDHQYLSQALKPIDTARFRIYFTGKESMIMIESDGIQRYKHLMAPLYLNTNNNT